MDTQTNRPPPRFDAPPVIETVLGVEFEALEKWGIQHIGVFWETVKENFPDCEIKPPLNSQIETYDPKPSSSATQISFTTIPEVRSWFVDQKNECLIQVQKDRFTFNWKKGASPSPYPQYEQYVRPAFQRAWQDFCRFVELHDLGKVKPLQCEVTYVNHLDIGCGWETAADLKQVFPSWSGNTSGDFLPPPESLSLNVNYRVPGELARLKISAHRAIRNADGVEVMQLNLTARTKPDEADQEDSVLRSLDLGHDWVVRGFADFTSSHMHKIWKRVE